MKPTTTYPLTVYFDASCELCSREMNAMKSRDTAGRLRLIDCSPPGFDAGPAPRAALMRALHAVDADGRLRVGVAAIRACRRAVGMSDGGRLLDRPPIAALADRAYAVLARHRHRLPPWLAKLLAAGASAHGSCAAGNCRL